eukprot:jgi/Chrzof1/5054/Cz15g10020.t1
MVALKQTCSHITRHSAHRTNTIACIASTQRSTVFRPHRVVTAFASTSCNTNTDVKASPAALSRRQVLALLPYTALCGQVAAALFQSPPASAATSTGAVLPSAECQKAIDQVLNKAVTKQKAPVLLRLAYHDAGTFSQTDGTGGLNASIQFELDRPENFGLKRGWRVIQEIKSSLKGTAADGVVSYADLIALAGAKAVAVCGGPIIQVSIGRQDATAADPAGRMASEQSGVQQLKANFANKGFDTRDLVVLSGAHTLGGKGFGDPVTFDNAYYSALLQKPWLNTKDEMATHIGLPSDHALPEDAECNAMIQEYAADQQAFFRDFAGAYAKLSITGAQWA